MHHLFALPGRLPFYPCFLCWFLPTIYSKVFHIFLTVRITTRLIGALLEPFNSSLLGVYL